jgi:anti-sigma regulatory factor (Ser/Thr protein kinase)
MANSDIETVYFEQNGDIPLYSIQIPLPNTPGSGIRGSIITSLEKVVEHVVKAQLSDKKASSEALSKFNTTETYEKIVYNVRLVEEEMIVNSIKHSGGKEGDSIQFNMYQKGDGLYLAMQDGGKGYDLEEELRLAGSPIQPIRHRRGLKLITLVSDMVYTKKDEKKGTFTIYAGFNLGKIADNILKEMGQG